MSYQEICTILSNKSVAKNTFIIELSSNDICKKIKAGEMVFLRITNGVSPLLRRPFAALTATTKSISILYRVVGLGTELLCKKKVGDNLDVMGPLGSGFPIKIKEKTIYALAGGCGIGPVFFACNAYAKQGNNVTLLYGAKDKLELAKFNFSKSFKTILCTDNGSIGQKGFVTDILKNKITLPAKDSIIIACGPTLMMRSAYKLSQEMGCQCLVSLERHMACGVGACNGCIVNVTDKNGAKFTKRVCKDGPIFNAGDIIWD